MADDVSGQFEQVASLARACARECGAAMEQVSEDMARIVCGGHTLFLCGNGGSAADAQHLAAEFIVRMRAGSERQALPALALTTDTSVLTACANDYGFEAVFARQLEALGREGDMLLGLSTSGNSVNVRRAFEMASRIGLHTVLLCGRDSGAIGPLAGAVIRVPATDVARIQEMHGVIGHILVDSVEERVFRKTKIGGKNA